MTFDGEDAAGNAAGFVPDFDGKAAGTDFESIVASEQWHWIFAIFERGRSAACSKKGLDGRKEEFGIACSEVQLIVVAKARHFAAKKGRFF